MGLRYIKIISTFPVMSQKKVTNEKIYTSIFLGLLEHTAEEHGEELRRLCLVCAEAVEDSEGGGTASKSPSFLFYLLKLEQKYKKAFC
jgi:hypothetical protein